MQDRNAIVKRNTDSANMAIYGLVGLAVFAFFTGKALGAAIFLIWLFFGIQISQGIASCLYIGSEGAKNWFAAAIFFAGLSIFGFLASLI